LPLKIGTYEWRLDIDGTHEEDWSARFIVRQQAKSRDDVCWSSSGPLRERWVARLDELGIAHSGIDDQHYGSGVSFRDPDGIALEFFAPPGL
jgi:catechol 2,3-dioxygenase-like lactoylglutathione lyase family enzyme